MKLSLKHQAKEKRMGNTCMVAETDLQHPHLNAAIATISGRYPDEKRVVNHECAEFAYVIQGQGKIVVNGKEQPLNIGDMLVIEPGEKYFWEGNMQLLLSCHPQWHKEQHEIVE